MLPSCDVRSITKVLRCQATYVDGKDVKIARSERSYYCYIHMPTFRIVWLLRNLSLGGKLCLRDDKNMACI